MAGGTPLIPEQKTLAEDLTPVSPIESDSEPDLGPSRTDTRERSLSGATRRNSFYDTQRTGKRPGSSTSQAAARSKGKKPNVDFREPPESSSKSETATGEGVSRPQHARGNSYTNFSRPDPARRNSGKSATQPGNLKNSSGNTSDPQSHTPSASRSAIKQKRASGTSTIGSRKLRPPIHQSDLERGDNTSSEESAPVPPFAQSLATDFLAGRKGHPQPPPPFSWLTELYTVSYLIFFAFFGTLARLGIEWLTFYPGAIITTPVVWANFAGSLFMGFLVEDSRMFRDHWPATTSITSRAEKRMSKQSTKSRRSLFSGDFDRMQRRERLRVKASIPLYVGLTTGFCGCFTSFSLFARDMFLALSNDLPAPPYRSIPGDSISLGATLPRNGGYSFMAVVAVIITELTLSIGGFIVGRHLALLLEDYIPRISLRFTSRFLDKLVIILGWGCWLGAIFLTIWPPDRPAGPQSAGSWANETWRGIALFSMVFSPVGCLLRYFLGRKLNRLEPSFPLGTFAANMLGAAILAVCYDIQHISVGEGGSIGGGLISCQALEGVIDGFTGCLTTVSTLAAELDALKRKYAWIYGLSTILAGLGLMVAILGSVRWTVGWSAPICVVGYINKYS